MPICLSLSISADYEAATGKILFNVILNNSIIINLEMQIADLRNWRSRSVSYLCRSYDSLNRGGKYADAKPVIHIGFLDFSLEGAIPEFYAAYKLKNVKTGQIYSDNVTLCVVDLNKMELAIQINTLGENCIRITHLCNSSRET